jgi:MFS family permease
MADSKRPAIVAPRSESSTSINRWGIAAAGVVMQIALGAVYAWSVFRIPLTKAFGWTISQVTLTFTIAILMLGFAAFVGGLWMRKSGPRRVAIVAGIFYGAGVFLASLSGICIGCTSRTAFWEALGLAWATSFRWQRWSNGFPIREA